MRIIRATGEEMLELWGYKDANTASPTARFFFNNLTSGNALFWALDDEGEIEGELYAFLNLEDKDFADGERKAYLCAFRVKEEYRGQGYGSQLINTAVEELSKKGFCSLTIGVDSDVPQNVRLYKRLGFNTIIKDCHYDPCSMDENMQPHYEENVWWLLQKEL